MSTQARWLDANQQHMATRLAMMRARLAGHEPSETPPDEWPADLPPPVMAQLAALFTLSPFEEALLLLCVGVEMDAALAMQLAALQKEGGSNPTFAFALAALPDAHWSALSPSAPLRHWHLIEVGAGESLVTSPLRADEWVLHFVAGIPHLDERLVGYAAQVSDDALLTPSQRALADEIATLWAQGAAQGRVPAAQLLGGTAAARRGVAAAACARLGLTLYAIPTDFLPTAPADVETLSRLWQREAALGGHALLLEAAGREPEEGLRRQAFWRFVESLGSPTLLAAPERWSLPSRPLVPFELPRPTPREQRERWHEALGPLAATLDGHVERLISHFDLEPRDIVAAVERSRAAPPDAPLAQALWEACRVAARPRLDELAQRIEALATWETLILPPRQMATLREIAMHVRHRGRVYEEWGFGALSARGLGISALFAGPSGTGKTMAAEVLANALSLDLYRIDLSQVVSKYIGETEKNLRRVFDAAESGGAILLFDEADALFGKRSEVKDSHDRYANIEVSYLLQRMESYRGLAILTSNMRGALDDAFTRRIRFIVGFPFPDPLQRAAIWRGIFPPDTPTEGLNEALLAQLNVAGGNIRNIALQAAFLAADEETPVRMGHLLHATRHEYGKLDKPLTTTEIRGW